MTEGTLEFYDAIMNANEAAQELIDKFGLVAGQDYAIGKGGLIEINEEALARGQFEQQQTVSRAAAANTQARIDKANYMREKAIGDMVAASEQRTGYTYKLSRENAEAALQGKGGSGDLEKGIGSMLSSVYENVVNNLVNGHGYADLTDVQGKLRPVYEQAVEEARQLKLALADQVIRGYASQRDVNVYSAMNSRGQDIVKQYVAEQMDANKEDRSMYNFTREIGKIYEGIPVLGDLGKWWGKTVADLTPDIPVLGDMAAG